MPDALTVAVTLRSPTAADRQALAALRADEDAQALLMTHPERRAENDADAWIQRRSGDLAGKFWAVAAGESCVGFAQVTNWHKTDRHAWFGVGLKAEARGRGLGRATMQALFMLTRQEMGLRKLLCEVRADNGPALSLYASLSFRTVGLLERHYDDGARLWDVVVMERFLTDAP